MDASPLRPVSITTRSSSAGADAQPYIALSQAINLVDLGRGSGAFEQALQTTPRPLTLVGVDRDRLYPLDQQNLIPALAPGAGRLWLIHSLHAGDGFRVEHDQRAAIIREALARGRAAVAATPGRCCAPGDVVHPAGRRSTLRCLDSRVFSRAALP